MGAVLTFSPAEESLVVGVDGRPYVFRGEKRVSQAEKLFASFADKPDTVALSVMGGMGQEFMMRLADDYGLSVFRIPFFKLQDLAGIETKSSAQNRSDALLFAWETLQEAFYPLEILDREALLLRDFIRTRTAIQNALRKPVQLQFYATLNRLRFMLPMETEEYVDTIIKAIKEKFRKRPTLDWLEQNLPVLESAVGSNTPIYKLTSFYSNPGFIRALLDDERHIESIILPLCRMTPLWELVHPPEDSRLPEIKGLGPAIYGGIYSEIGSIKRFHYSSDLRSYARLGLAFDFEKNRYVFPRRISGNVSPWNDRLFQVVWNWSAGQLHMWDSVWRDLYYWKKYDEMMKHPVVIPVKFFNAKGEEKTRYDFSLKHLDSRARRYTASIMLEYLFHLWWSVVRGEDPEEWYKTAKRWVPANPNQRIADSYATNPQTWDQWFTNDIQGYMGREQIMPKLKAEIEKRRRNEPEEADTEDQSEE